MRKIDGHVHLIGDGSDGSGCWLGLSNPLRISFACLLAKSAGLPLSVLKSGMDSAYLEQALKWIEDSSLDAVVLLAMDYPHDSEGLPMRNKASFYVPNPIVLSLGRKHEEFIPACSIHPARKDAIEELEKCIAEGAKVMKLLPNCHNVDCSDRSYRDFWEKVSRAGLVFLAHTGGEFSVPVVNAGYADPRVLRLPLECGVKTIAAHGAGRSGILDPDYTSDLFSMFEQYPNLFTDNSALCSPNRWRTAKALLSSRFPDRVIHGSDYPVPVGGVGPLMGGLITSGQWRQSRALSNPLERDCFLKRAMGFPDSSFTKLEQLLPL